MQQAALLQANLDSNQNTELPGLYIGAIVEVREAVDKINTEELEDIFNTIADFHIGSIPIQITDR